MSAMVGRMSDENGGMVVFLAAVKWSALCLSHGMVDGGGGGGEEAVFAGQLSPRRWVRVWLVLVR